MAVGTRTQRHTFLKEVQCYCACVFNKKLDEYQESHNQFDSSEKHIKVALAHLSYVGVVQESISQNVKYVYEFSWGYWKIQLEVLSLKQSYDKNISN